MTPSLLKSSSALLRSMIARVEGMLSGSGWEATTRVRISRCWIDPAHAVADSQERAEAIANLGVAEPAGILRQLQEAVE